MEKGGQEFLSTNAWRSRTPSLANDEPPRSPRQPAASAELTDFQVSAGTPVIVPEPLVGH